MNKRQRQPSTIFNHQWRRVTSEKNAISQNKNYFYNTLSHLSF